MEEGASSLRNKLAEKKAEQAAREASERESLVTKLTQQKAEQALEVLRGEIKILEEKKRKIVEAQTFLNSGAENVKAGVVELTEGKKLKKVSAKRLAEQEQALAELIREHEDFFTPKGITTPEQLASSSEFSADREAVSFKEAQISVVDAEEKKATKRSSLKGKVASLKQKRVEIKQGLPDQDIKLFLREPQRSEIQKKLQTELERIDNELDAFKFKTPEGQKEIQDQLGALFSARFNRQDFLYEIPRGYGLTLLSREDMGLVEKYGADFVVGTIRTSAEEKLAKEVVAEKQKTGVQALREDIDKLKRLPEEYKKLASKAENLKNKRSQLRGQIAQYINSDSKLSEALSRAIGNTDPYMLADKWLWKLERDLFTNTDEEGHTPLRADTSPEFFASKIQAAQKYFEAFQTGKDYTKPAEHFLDPVSFDAYLIRYEAFLDGCREKIVDVKNAKLLKASYGASDYSLSINPESYLGFKLDREGPYANSIKLGPGMLAELKAFNRSTDNPRSGKLPILEDIEAEINKKEKPIDEKAAKVKAYLDAQVDSELAGLELSKFEGENPKAKELFEKVTKLEKIQPSAQKIPELVFRAKQEIGTLSSADVDLLNELEIKGNPKEFWNPNLVNEIDFKLKELRESLAKATRSVLDKKEEKRPFLPWKSKTYDAELATLEQNVTDKRLRVESFQSKRDAVINLQDFLKVHLQPIVQSWEQMGIKNWSPNISEMLANAEAEARKVLAETISTDEKRIAEEYKKFNENYTRAREAWAKKDSGK